MAQALILDTTFLIDLERETRRGSGRASRFLETHQQDLLYLTFTVAGELAGGSSLDQHEDWRWFIEPFQILESSKEVSWQYGVVYRELKSRGELIGSNDLWIAATAFLRRSGTSL